MSAGEAGATRPYGSPEPDDLRCDQCPHCSTTLPRNRVDEHVRDEHADLPACTARLNNEHGLYTCAFRDGHKDGEYGDWHASAWGAPAGRTVWEDSADGAMPHQQGQQFTVPTDSVAGKTVHIPKPDFLVSLREDDGTLIVGIRPDGSITTGPRYEPDAAAREFWDAVTRAAQAANPWDAT